MTTKLAFEVLKKLSGRTLATAESCTGGGIGAAITAVSGASKVYKGGVISYCDQVKNALLGVPKEVLEACGAVSKPVAACMAEGVRDALKAGVAVSTTGLLGPGGDDRGNPVGTVFIGYADEKNTLVREYHLTGSREEIRQQVIRLALELILEQ